MFAAGLFHSRKRLLSALLFLVISSAASRAQQPFVTDDADTTPKHHFHFEFSDHLDVLQRSSFPSREQNTAFFRLNYGLLDKVELGVELPIITIFNARVAGATTVSGPGDTTFSLKYNFLKEREPSRRPALTVVINFQVPTGNVRRQLGSGLSDFFVNGILQKSVTSKTKLRLNGGILFAGNETTGVVGIKTRGTVFTGGGSLVKVITPKLQLGIELVGAVTKNFQLGRNTTNTAGWELPNTAKHFLRFRSTAGEILREPKSWGSTWSLDRLLSSQSGCHVKLRGC